MVEDDANSLWQVARTLDIENKLRSLNRSIALQGELVGEGIQGNKLKLRGQTVMFFNAFDVMEHRCLMFGELHDLLRALDLPMVPVLDENYILDNRVDTLVQLATRRSALCADSWAEGIVIRPHTPDIRVYSNHLSQGRVSFKAINPEFLLKHGE